MFPSLLRPGTGMAMWEGQAGCISRTMKSVPRRRSWLILTSHPDEPRFDVDFLAECDIMHA